MYKVFVNNKILLLGARPETGLPEGTRCDESVRITGTGPVREVIHACFRDHSPGVICLNGDPAAWSVFQSAFVAIEAAGGLVRDDQGRLLMIFRNGKWDLPKGKLEAGEAVDQAAIREVCEETGVCDLEIVSPPRVTYHAYPLGKKEALKRTSWYDMRCRTFNGFSLQQEEGIERAGWFTRAETEKQLVNSYPLIRELLK